jgi:hypothetical protein
MATFQVVTGVKTRDKVSPACVAAQGFAWATRCAARVGSRVQTAAPRPPAGIPTFADRHEYVLWLNAPCRLEVAPKQTVSRPGVPARLPVCAFRAATTPPEPSRSRRFRPSSAVPFRLPDPGTNLRRG